MSHDKINDCIKILETKGYTIKKKRCSVEFNGTELVCALILLFPYIEDYNSLIDTINKIENNEIQTILEFNSINDLNNYKNDIIHKKKLINRYISNFKKEISSVDIFNLKYIKKVYISGKHNKHSELNILNKNISKSETKSDLYIKLNTGEYIGLSVKQDKGCTKSNYSVQKMFPFDTDKELTKIKKDFLKENGFEKFNKKYRKQINELFYPQKINPYMTRLKEEIKRYEEKIKSALIEKLYCYNTPYDVYEFNGNILYKFEKINSKIYFDIHIPYFYDKKGNERKTAKLFYKLIVGEKNYRVEVRWKGNIHNSSPQFQIHEE